MKGACTLNLEKRDGMTNTWHTLLIDTSLATNLSLAVARGVKVLQAQDLPLKHSLSADIIPAIENILKKSGMTLPEVDGLVVGLGPGSFTGLRVGVATIKGLAVALNKPVVGISSLAAVAMGVAHEGKVWCLGDAKRQQAYVVSYDRTADQCLINEPCVLWPLKELSTRIPVGSIVVGDGVAVWVQYLEKNKAKTLADLKITAMEASYNTSQAQHLLSLALPRFLEGQTDDVAQLVPQYIYPQDCQVRP